MSWLLGNVTALAQKATDAASQFATDAFKEIEEEEARQAQLLAQQQQGAPEAPLEVIILNPLAPHEVITPISLYRK